MALTRGDKTTAKRFFSQSRRWGTNWDTPWESYQAAVELAKEQLRSGMIDDAIETIKNNGYANYWLKQFSLQMLHEDRFDEALTIADGITNDVCFHAEVVTRIALRMAKHGKTQEARRIFFDLIRRATVFRKTPKESFTYQRRHFPRIIQGMILAGFHDDAEYAVSNWPYRDYREDADVPNGAIAVALAKEGQENHAIELEGRIANVAIRANTAKRMGVGQAQHGFLDAADRSFQRGVRWTELIDDPYERVKSYKALAFAYHKYLRDGFEIVEKLFQQIQNDIEQIGDQEKRRIATKMLEKLGRS